MTLESTGSKPSEKSDQFVIARSDVESLIGRAHLFKVQKDALLQGLAGIQDVPVSSGEESLPPEPVIASVIIRVILEELGIKYLDLTPMERRNIGTRLEEFEVILDEDKL